MLDNIVIGSEEIEICDFTNPQHCERLCEMVNNFISDPMGYGEPLTDRNKLRLLDGLESHPSSLVLFASDNDKIVGFVTVFILFSTFIAAPVMNIHDVFVEKDHRHAGWAEKMLNEVIKIAEQKRCGKVTLEVRKDNTGAQNLYKKLGFLESDSPMYFWVKEL